MLMKVRLSRTYNAMQYIFKDGSVNTYKYFENVVYTDWLRNDHFTSVAVDEELSFLTKRYRRIKADPCEEAGAW